MPDVQNAAGAQFACSKPTGCSCNLIIINVHDSLGLARASADEDYSDGPLAKRSRRSTARALESAQLEAMDVFGDKEDEEDRYNCRNMNIVTLQTSISNQTRFGGIQPHGRNRISQYRWWSAGGVQPRAAAAQTAAAASGTAAAAAPAAASLSC